MDNVLRGIINDVAQQMNKEPHEVEDVIMDMFGFIREKIDAVDFSTLETEEDFRKAKTNFNIPRVCKLFTTPKRVEHVKAKIGKVYPPDVQRARFNDNPESGEAE